MAIDGICKSRGALLEKSRRVFHLAVAIDGNQTSLSQYNFRATPSQACSRTSFMLRWRKMHMAIRPLLIDILFSPRYHRSPLPSHHFSRASPLVRLRYLHTLVRRFLRVLVLWRHSSCHPSLVFTRARVTLAVPENRLLATKHVRVCLWSIDFQK